MEKSRFFNRQTFNDHSIGGSMGSRFERLITFALAVSATSTLFVIGPSRVAGASDKKDAQYVKTGRALFVQYCVSCHGSSGMGEGPAAASLKSPVPDLTSIALMYNGFPFDRITNTIDGEKASSAHGTREMPVWGKRFRDAKRGEASGYGDVYSLTKYIQSIQK
jgi:mono/diheme cytochrome c family protein